MTTSQLVGVFLISLVVLGPITKMSVLGDAVLALIITLGVKLIAG